MLAQLAYSQSSVLSPAHFLSLSIPIRLEYFSGWIALGLFVIIGLPILWLGMRSLNGLGPVRKWVAIGVRLLVLLVFILLLGGMRWQRTHTDLEVMVVRDISDSTAQARDYPGSTLSQSIDDWLRDVSKENKPPDDRIGVLSFHSRAQIDAMPNTTLMLDTRAIRGAGSGTDAASAIQLALATLSRDAMHRLVLVWDGNQTAGDIESAVAQAIAQKVPIDVFPLKYDVQSEVMLERFVAPPLKRENEPFTIDVILRSTNVLPVTGKLTVTHSGAPMDLDPFTEGVQATRLVTLQPGLNRELVKVPPLHSAGVHQFHATFEGENVSAEVGGAGQGSPGDTLLANNGADAFTFVRGKGEVLYVDNVFDVNGNRGPGRHLADAMAAEGVQVRSITIDQFPADLVTMQNFDAVILANVPRGAGGLELDQESMLASYVHDMGGGLVMIGGPDAFGAGGWQGSRLEAVLPVNMDIPAQRQMPKGALVLVMHSCEMPDGNYWGELCALKAIETLSAQDEIGVISYGWGGAGGGGSVWDFPLEAKGDGSKVMAAVKKMQLGDMPSFDDSMDLAVNGRGGSKGLKDSDARQKHVIIISDGDPAAPQQSVIDSYINNKISVSTISVYPHMGDPDGLPPVMKDVANRLKGRAYGPINNNPNQLPQIFIKEATVVRRSLIHEDRKGIQLKLPPSASDIMKGVGEFPPVFGMVLTSRKPSPQIEVPIVAGVNNDPIFAHWQTGLGKAAVFTSDAHNKWASPWLSTPTYEKFWAQVVRGVSRPPMSTDFEVRMTQEGDNGKITVEAANRDSGFLSFLNFRGTVVGPDGKPTDVRLLQTGPGTYTAEFDTPLPGNYVAGLQYTGTGNQAGWLPAGLAVNSSPELRDLRSNDGLLARIAEQTGGRVLTPFAVAGANLFTREGVNVTASPLPVWDILIPILLGLILVDVAIRRIAWDWMSMKKGAIAVASRVRGFTVVPKVETRQTLDALKRVRDEVAEQKFKQDDSEPASHPPSARPDPKAKFEAGPGVEGDISKVVGGATDKPIPPPPKKIEPKGAPPAGGGGHTGSLLEAKRRAQQQIKQKEQE
jgi:uncharacterized membrane protein